MGNVSLWRGAVGQRLRGSLWLMPSVAVAFALALGGLLSQLEHEVPDERRGVLDIVLFAGGPDAARGMLETVAGSVITITSLVFSLTIIALQLASSNYSPRVLRMFLRHRGTQVVLSVFLATFAYSYTVLRAVRSEMAEQEAFTPVVAVNVLSLFVLASLAALVYFIHHLTQAIRLETILDGVQTDTLGTIDRAMEDPVEREPTPDRPPPGEASEGGSGSGPEMPDVPPRAAVVPAQRSGYVQAAEPEELVGPLAKAGLVVRFRPILGDYVPAGTVLAWVWTEEPAHEPPETRELSRMIRPGLHLGAERTMQQDVGYGITQLIDIAVRALSPGINDPTTAVQVLTRLALPLCALIRRPLTPSLCRDADGVVRVAVPQRDFAGFLDLACAPIRRYGAHDVQVVRRLVKLLGEVGMVTGSEARRTALREELDRLLEAAEATMQFAPDREAVEREAATARRVLRGDLYAPG